ncbi:MAG: DUF4386 domain-containing protein [Myxococcota bacterium]
MSSSSRLAGLLVLPLLVLGPFCLVWIPSVVHVAGDPVATALAVIENAQVFRLGLLAEIAIAFTEVGMIVALHRLFGSAGPELSVAAALARFVMVALMGVSVVAGLVALHVAPASPELVEGLMVARASIQDVWEAFFALHLLLLAPLVGWSGRVPRVFGPMLVAAGLGYAANSLGVLVWPAASSWTETVVMVTSMLGEVPLFFWLLFKGVSTGTVAETASATVVRAVGLRMEPSR